MIIQSEHRLDLTYCLNVHPGETWEAVCAAIEEKSLAVRRRVAPGIPFGLGLRLGRAAAVELAETGTRERFKEYLRAHDLYVPTLNGFPYGAFHGRRVKEQVYEPDWRTPERLEYTRVLAAVLADLLEEGRSGGISTVPCGFKPRITTARDVDAVVKNLLDMAAYLARLRDLTGRDIHLGLEPEPGCYLESTEEARRFFLDRLLTAGAPEELVRRHIGICLDTCHCAVQFEDPAEALERLSAEGIRISKIQLSAALRANVGGEALRALEAFEEPVYLHQTRARSPHGLAAWNDLPDARAALREAAGFTEMRTHFHVPLYWEGTGVLGSTITELGPAFFRRLREGIAPHVEIETYTFDVLPEEATPRDVVESIAREYEWVRPRLEGRGGEGASLS